MPCCCAYQCSNNTAGGFKLYRIPDGNKNVLRRKIWIVKIGRRNWTPTPGTRLCEAHFTQDAFENGRCDGKRFLKANAIPSIFSHRPTPKLRQPSSYVNRQSSNKSKSNTSILEHGYARYADLHLMNDPNNEAFANKVMIEDSQNSLPVITSCIPVGVSSIDQFNNPACADTTSRTDTVVNITSSPNVDSPEGHFVTQGGSDSPNTAASTNTLVNITSSPNVDSPEGHFVITPDVADYQKTIAALKRKIALLQRKNNRIESENKKLMESFHSIFDDDQLSFLKTGGTHVGKKWSDKTVQKSLQLRLNCGFRGYQCLLNMGYPLPCERTLQRRLQNLKLNPGNAEMFNLLELKVKSMTPEERHCSSMLDEMALSAGLDSDVSSGHII